MKIYLLMMLIGTLFTAVHFTSTPEQRLEARFLNKPDTAEPRSQFKASPAATAPSRPGRPDIGLSWHGRY